MATAANCLQTASLRVCRDWFQFSLFRARFKAAPRFEKEGKGNVFDIAMETTRSVCVDGWTRPTLLLIAICINVKIAVNKNIARNRDCSNWRRQRGYCFGEQVVSCDFRNRGEKQRRRIVREHRRRLQLVRCRRVCIGGGIIDVALPRSAMVSIRHVNGHEAPPPAMPFRRSAS